MDSMRELFPLLCVPMAAIRGSEMYRDSLAATARGPTKSGAHGCPKSGGKKGGAWACGAVRGKPKNRL